MYKIIAVLFLFLLNQVTVLTNSFFKRRLVVLFSTEMLPDFLGFSISCVWVMLHTFNIYGDDKVEIKVMLARTSNKNNTTLIVTI